MDKILTKYLQPDETWSIWKINSHEEFLEKFMVAGKFHKDVPDQIIKDYEIVERLICYSYYHYPMFDEAFSKITRLFEAAVNLRLEMSGIEKSKKFQSLNVKLKKLEKLTSIEIYKQWDNAREIRNVFAHRDAGCFMGIIIYRSLLQMVNIINTLFLNKNITELNKSSLEIIETQSRNFRNGLFILEFEGKNYLGNAMIPYAFFKKDTINLSFWVFHPILTHFPQTVDKLAFTLPFFLRLKDIKIKDDILQGINLTNGKSIILTVTNKEEDINKFKAYKAIFETSETKVKKIHLSHFMKEVSFEITKFLYYECWE
jgi:hypothetical protein